MKVLKEGAQRIFKSMRWALGNPPEGIKPLEAPDWAEDGNSFAQREAEEAARQVTEPYRIVLERIKVVQKEDGVWLMIESSDVKLHGGFNLGNADFIAVKAALAWEKDRKMVLDRE